MELEKLDGDPIAVRSLSLVEGCHARSDIAYGSTDECKCLGHVRPWRAPCQTGAPVYYSPLMD
jgi:hypothetical protein